jgi:hypothetical protein
MNLMTTIRTGWTFEAATSAVIGPLGPAIFRTAYLLSGLLKALHCCLVFLHTHIWTRLMSERVLVIAVTRGYSLDVLKANATRISCCSRNLSIAFFALAKYVQTICPCFSK